MSFVVIVEPDEMRAGKLKDFLDSTETKFEYTLVRSPDRAIEILEQRQVDVLVCEAEMPIISGRELLSMTEMISPDTVRIAMTNALKIEDTIAFMNACRTYKVIVTPCKLSNDIVDPIESAIEYKQLMNQIKHEEEYVNATINEAESDYSKMERESAYNKERYQEMISIIQELVDKNLEKTSMGDECRQKMKNWYAWLLNAYYRIMVASNGNYILAINSLMNDFHDIANNRRLAVYKKTEFTISPSKMNEIVYMISVMANTCKLLINQYNIHILLECTEKYYIVRFECRFADVMDREKQLSYYEENQEFIRELTEATKAMTGLFSYRAVMLEKEESYLINIAVKR